jgi:uncharacterized repeat protein (TIGR04138 family)
MHPVGFEQAVISILQRDRRFDGQAYLFLKEALDHTIGKVKDRNGGHGKHVTGPELLAGFRDHALAEFGPMASTLMEEWGVRSGRDVGDMVFHLIDEQVFGRQESDRREDFDGVFDLMESLTGPFLPLRKRQAGAHPPLHRERA